MREFTELAQTSPVLGKAILGTIPPLFWHDTPATIIQGFGILVG
jgi:hypothetical protein